jgi:hypothetical protein
VCFLGVWCNPLAATTVTRSFLFSRTVLLAHL